MQMLAKTLLEAVSLDAVSQNKKLLSLVKNSHLVTVKVEFDIGVAYFLCYRVMLNNNSRSQAATLSAIGLAGMVAMQHNALLHPNLLPFCSQRC